MSLQHLIVAPARHLGNTLGFVNSIDSQIARDRLVLVDNTDGDEVYKACWDDVRTIRLRPGNAGVAASWNLGIEEANDVGAQFLTICSTSIRFRDYARGLCRTADLAAENDQWPYGFESAMGWRMITLGRATWETIGLFDEKFYPAYYEDNDYIWRMRCAGILEQQGAESRSLRMIPWVGALDADLVCEAHAIKHAGVHVDFVELEQYYMRKWNGKPGEEQWDESFNGEVA